jgi:hypothetical protein
VIYALDAIQGASAIIEATQFPHVCRETYLWIWISLISSPFFKSISTIKILFPSLSLIAWIEIEYWTRCDLEYWTCGIRRFNCWQRLQVNCLSLSLCFFLFSSSPSFLFFFYFISHTYTLRRIFFCFWFGLLSCAWAQNSGDKLGLFSNCRYCVTSSLGPILWNCISFHFHALDLSVLYISHWNDCYLIDWFNTTNRKKECPSFEHLRLASLLLRTPFLLLVLLLLLYY